MNSRSSGSGCVQKARGFLSSTSRVCTDVLCGNLLISYVKNDVEFDSSLKHIIPIFLKLRAITCSISALNDFFSLFLVSISQCNDISVQTFVCSEPVAGGLISEKPYEVFICVTICSFVNQSQARAPVCVSLQRTL